MYYNLFNRPYIHIIIYVYMLSCARRENYMFYIIECYISISNS